MVAKPHRNKASRNCPAYLKAIRTESCWNCGYHKAEPHHFPHKGMGAGGNWHDLRTVALCRGCHRQCHDSPPFEQSIMTARMYERQLCAVIQYMEG